MFDLKPWMLRGASGIKFLNLSVVEMTAVMKIGKIRQCISMKSYNVLILNKLQDFAVFLFKNSYL